MYDVQEVEVIICFVHLPASFYYFKQTKYWKILKLACKQTDWLCVFKLKAVYYCIEFDT